MLLCKEASPSEIRTAYAQVHTMWPHAPVLTEHLELRLSSVQHQRATWFVGLIDNEVAVSLGAYPYRLYSPRGEREARVFGAVFTAATWRRRGFAATLLRSVMARYQGQGVQDFLLYSDIDPAYYERLGFQTLPSYAWELKVPPKTASDELGKNLGVLPARLMPGYRYGFIRSTADREWLWTKHDAGIQCFDYEGLYLLSKIEAQAYILLETNAPQTVALWSDFCALVAIDAQRRGMTEARGWWQGSGGVLPPEVKPRTNEILMWAELSGEGEPTQAAEEGFRVSLAEHV